MKNYDFTIALSGVDSTTDGLEDRIFEAGCDDTLLCFCNEIPYLEYTREAETAEAAIQQALTQLTDAGFAVSSIQQAGFVTVTGAAAMADIKKSTFDHYAKGRRGEGFPAPRYGLQSGTPLYYWPEIATWLVDNQKAPAQLLEVALAAVKLSRANLDF